MLVLHSFPSTHIYRYSICHQDSWCLYSNSHVVPPSYSLAVSLIRALVLFAGASAYLPNSFPGLHDGAKTNACHSQSPVSSHWQGCELLGHIALVPYAVPHLARITCSINIGGDVKLLLKLISVGGLCDPPQPVLLVRVASF